jgi:transcriptional regulator with PAS, ATPase and Fis domain
MHELLVLARNEHDTSYLVLKNSLEHLIRERKIQQFRRSNGWLAVDEDQRKTAKGAYAGPERRASRILDAALFSRSIPEQLRHGFSVEVILGHGQRARELAAKLRSVARTNLSVLIQGKTGTGKGVAALILHELSARRDKPFIRVDCGAIPPTLIESELFGYEKGSFTGAFRSKPGRFQLANGGTIFLDEIANLGMDMQTRLLGFLEEHVVNSIGGVNAIRLDVRVVSATNADLMDQIRRYQFREDLFYRLNEFELEMPPLRERADDLFYLATKFLAVANAELGKQVFGFSQEAIDFLSEYTWGGNIRELKNSIKKAALFADEVIEAEHLRSSALGGEAATSLDGLLENAFIKGLPLAAINEVVRKAIERRIIERVYEQSHRNKKKTCQALGIDYSTLYRKMKEYGPLFFREDRSSPDEPLDDD